MHVTYEVGQSITALTPLGTGLFLDEDGKSYGAVVSVGGVQFRIGFREPHADPGFTTLVRPSAIYFVRNGIEKVLAFGWRGDCDPALRLDLQ
jgi:hypothetical protein